MDKEPIQHRLNDVSMKELTIGMLEMVDPIMESILIREYNRRSMRGSDGKFEDWEISMLCSQIGGGRHTIVGGYVDDLCIDEAVRLGPIFNWPRPAKKFGILRLWISKPVWLVNVAYSVENFMLGYDNGMPYIDRGDIEWDREMIPNKPYFRNNAGDVQWERVNQ